MKTYFHAVDMNTWPRAQTYTYFTNTVSTLIYSINVTLDVTIVKNPLKKQKLKFFPAYLYLITHVLNEQKEFLMAVQNDTLGYWNDRTPCYPILHKDDKTLTFLWTVYNDNFNRFYEQYMSDMDQYGKQHGILSAKGKPPSNSYIIACTPWFSFNSLSMQLQNATYYYAPLFEAGGFSQIGNTIGMPLSITVNHAVIDGYHIKVFLEKLQWMMDHPENWL